MTAPVTVAASGYASPGGTWPRGTVLECTSAQVTQIGSGNLRAVDTAHMHDQLGESSGVSNGN